MVRIRFTFKTGCDISGIRDLLTIGPLTLNRMVALRTIDLCSYLDLSVISKVGHVDQFYITTHLTKF
jgi:hypothetical protein